MPIAAVILRMNFEPRNSKQEMTSLKDDERIENIDSKQLKVLNGFQVTETK